MNNTIYRQTFILSKISFIILKEINNKSILNRNFNIIKNIFKLAEKLEINIDEVKTLFKLSLPILKTKVYNFISEFYVNQIRCIWLNNFNQESNNIIFYFHGGGYCVGSPEVYYDFLIKIKRRVIDKNVNIILIDYKKMPEFKNVHIINSTYKTYSEIVKFYKEKNIIFMGDSAGGNLALQICNQAILNNDIIPKTVICLSPWVITKIRSKYWKLNENKDFLNSYCINLAIDTFKDQNLLKENQIDILDFNYDKFPDILVRFGTHELILDEILVLIQKIKKCKCNLESQLIDEMVHSFDLLYSFSDIESPKFNKLIDYINEYLI